MTWLSEFYQAPNTIGVELPTRELLLARLATNDAVDEVLWLLGNLSLRDTDYGEAERCFREAVQAKPDCAELRYNHAFALTKLERGEEAKHLLRQLTLSHPQLLLPHVLLAQIFFAERDFEQAQGAVERGIRFHAESAPLLFASGELAEAAGDTVRAEVFYRRAAEYDPKFAEARYRLGRIAFYRGKALFDAGERQAAFRQWHEAYRTAPEVYYREPDVAKDLRGIISAFEHGGGARLALAEYEERYREDPKDQSALHGVTMSFLLSIGLLPECYEEAEELPRATERWLRELDTYGEHPYPHFRLGIVRCMTGELAIAKNEFRWCQDKLPPKKQEALRIRDLLDFVSSLEELQKRVNESRLSGASQDAWAEAGFTDPFQLRVWKETGLEPKPAAEWRAAGVSAKQATSWHRMKISVEEAVRWMNAGFEDAKAARMWLRGGFSPEDAKTWSEDFPRDVSEAIQWRRSGFEIAREARQWASVFDFPWAASQWRDLKFQPLDALSWLETGFRDPYLAAEWRNKGRTPAEALLEFNFGPIKPEKGGGSDPEGNDES